MTPGRGDWYHLEMEQITLRAIGRVRSPVKSTPKPEYDWRGIVSEIELEPGLAPGLEGLEGYSHVIVIYYADRATDPADMALRVRFKGDPDYPMVGVFASRSPYRPNPLGQKLARLLAVEGSKLRVEGLDAIDGTPVLDIKPFIPGYDSSPDATSPQWQG
jgi:tRNA-Thr(GGU) m(6)t(6)A37 methyltransferase TsaA